jgi:phytoene dehydrogenase-like protein
MTTRDYDAIVIGAGLNGLSAASLLAGAGQKVLVLERRGIPGGLACTEEFAPGFFCNSGVDDVGFLSPDLAGELGLERSLLPDPSSLPPLCVLLPGGGGLVLSGSTDEVAGAIRRRSTADGDRWPGFAERMRDHARILESLYEAPAPRVPDPGAGEIPRLLGLGMKVRRLGKDSMTALLRYLPMSAQEVLDEWFEDELLKGAMADLGCLGIFQGPRSAGTGFVMLHHMVGAGEAVHAPRGLVRGRVGRLPEALATAATNRGAEVLYGTPVKGVTLRDGRAVGVTTGDGREISARLVISGADPRTTFLDLVGAQNLSPEFAHRVTSIRYSGAWARVHLALGGLPGFRDLETDSLSGLVTTTSDPTELEKAYDDAKYGRVSDRRQLRLTIPSLADPSMAPEGGHAMSVHVRYVPYQLREDGGWTDSARQALGDRVVSTLESFAPGIGALVQAREILAPVDLEERFGIPEGCGAHGELGLDQILFMRPVPGWSRYRTPIEGLLLCGNGTHPGPGIVGGGGRLAAKEALGALRG